MAPLPPSVSRALAARRLRFDVDDIEAAYRAALGGLTHLQRDIEKEAREALGIGPDDEFPPSDADEPNDPVALLYDDAGEKNAQAKRGEPLVRKAFLIVLFHVWERHCCKILKRTTLGRNDIRGVLDLTEAEWSAHPIHLLQLAANCAKHGQGRAGAELYALHPEFFPKAVSVREATEWTLSISAETLDGWFAAVRRAASVSSVTSRP